jgi:hypothetical protein
VAKETPKIVLNPALVSNPLDTKLEPGKNKPPIIRAYYRPFVFGAIPINILNLVFTIIFYPYLPPIIPLLGTMVTPADRLVDTSMIWLLPILATSINLVHALVIYLGRKYEVTLLQIFDYFTIFIQGLLLAVLLRTILIII